MSLAFARCFRKDIYPRRKREATSFVVSRDVNPNATGQRTASSASDDTLLPPITPTTVSAKTSSVYPQQFQSTVQGRSKRALGDYFGLKNFGVNHTTLEPGAASALQHYHSKQDEFVYILQGTATVRMGTKEMEMKAGSCIGFPAGQGEGHCIVNRSKEPVAFLEIGDRTTGEEVDYPEVDLKCVEKNGKWTFLHKDGTPYEA